MNSKPEANWCGLPVEMQLECIERMDFKTRMCLRVTSKTEKSLVESAPKYNFDTIFIKWGEYIPLTLKCGKNNEMEVDYEDNRVLDMVRELPKDVLYPMQVFKFADAEKLKFHQAIDFEDEIPKFLAAISEFTPFRAKCMDIEDVEDHEIIHFLISNAENVETLVLNGYYEDDEDDEDDALVFNAKKVHNLFGLPPDCYAGLIEKWIERDAEIGKRIESCLYDESGGNNMRSIARMFSKRVVYKKPTEIRLRTDNHSKHILISALNDDDQDFVSFVIIPADQKEESKGKKKDFEWIYDSFEPQLKKLMKF